MRKIDPILCFVIGAILMSSCVSNRKVQYLQHNDVNADEVTLDSVVRTYNTQKFDYKVQPNDILSVQFESLTQKDFDFLRKEQTNNFQIANNNASALILGELVTPQGEIAFPVIGKVKVEGLTVFEIQEKLKKESSTFLKEVVVKVRLLNYRFTVLGEVKKEGTITSYNNQISIVEAIGLAGGVGDLADRRNVKLIRTKNGTTKVQYIDLLSEELVTSPYYYIHQNDILIVPPLKQRPFRKYSSQNLSLILSSISTILLVINLLRK